MKQWLMKIIAVWGLAMLLPLAAPALTTATPFQWLGGYGVYYDSDTELHLTLHRAYSSTMKRFIHPDPLGIDGGANVYMWANMNPLAFVDPYGLCADSAGGFFNTDIYGYASEWKTGLAEGAYNGIMGLGQFIRHPIQTVQGIPAGLKQGWRDTKQYWSDVWNGTGDPYDSARTVGKWTFNAEAAVVSGAGAKALQTKLTTPANGRVFWSGGTQARGAADAFARANGGTTLEMTFTGRALDFITTDATYPYLKPAWNAASKNFARGASGGVDVFHAGSGVRLESVWRTVEYPQLINQGNVINYNVVP